MHIYICLYHSLARSLILSLLKRALRTVGILPTKRNTPRNMIKERFTPDMCSFHNIYKTMEFFLDVHVILYRFSTWIFLIEIFPASTFLSDIKYCTVEWMIYWWNDIQFLINKAPFIGDPISAINSHRDSITRIDSAGALHYRAERNSFHKERIIKWSSCNLLSR